MSRKPWTATEVLAYAKNWAKRGNWAIEDQEDMAVSAAANVLRCTARAMFTNDRYMKKAIRSQCATWARNRWRQHNALQVVNGDALESLSAECPGIKATNDRIFLEECRQLIPPDDWAVFLRLAEGDELKVVAQDDGRHRMTLRRMIERTRRKLAFLEVAA